MTIHKLIFSDEPAHRITRHFVFWLVYSSYFWLQSVYVIDIEDVYLVETYRNALISLCCFLPSCLVSVYVFMYILLPAFLEKRKYYLFGLTYISMYVILTLVNNLFAELFISSITYEYATEDPFLSSWELSATNTMWAFSIGIIAMGIKLAKNRYIQNQENLLLMQRKSATELSYQRALLRPEYLTGKLDDIYSEIHFKPANAPEMVLRLSDLLSYMLYEGETEQVPLEKELSAVKDLIFLQQGKQNKSINIQLRIEGNANSKFVNSMVFLNLIQASVTKLIADKTSYYDLGIDITVETQTVVLEMLLNDVNERDDLLSTLSRLLEEKYKQIILSSNPFGVRIQETSKLQKPGIKIYLPLFSSKKIQHDIQSVHPKSLSYEL